MGLDLKIDNDGAAILREFAAAMPVALANIEESTERVLGIYQSVANSVGPHEQDFYDMLMTIKKAQEQARDAIMVLPKMLNQTADKIEAYVASRPSV